MGASGPEGFTLLEFSHLQIGSREWAPVPCRPISRVN